MVSHLRCLGEETASLFGEVTHREAQRKEDTENHGEKWLKWDDKLHYTRDGSAW